MQTLSPRAGRLFVAVNSISVLMAASCAGPHSDKPGIRDPYEPVNRGAWSANRAVNLGLMEPVSDFYLAVVPERVRNSIGNVRDNLGAPLRLTNQALQGRWQDSGRESARFLTNTTLGIGGLFDVARHMDLDGSEGNFNQTFQTWGMRPDTFVVLPFLGPSDNIALPARALDIAGDPSNYIDALQPVAVVTRVHQVSEITKNVSPFMRTEADSYSFTRLAWPYLSRADDPDWTLRGAPDMPTLQTLGAVSQGPRDSRFRSFGRKHFARIPGTGRDLPYNAWIQNGPAPLVYLNPGIGSHRESRNTLALAEVFHRMGFSVVTMSGIFHPEFMERGATALLPGNPRRDRNDVLATCTAIDADLMKTYRTASVTRRVLAGFSMGGYAAIQLAGTEAEHAPGSIRFDHYIAINAPVDLRESYSKLDAYFDVPQGWPASERESRVDNVFHKTAGIVKGQLPPGAPPFDGEESRMLVGYAFRYILRDAMFSIHKRTPQPGLPEASQLRREPLYDELMKISFDDYFQHWLKPNEQQNGVSEKGLLEKISLRSMERTLSGNSRVSFIGTRNDFLIDPRDIAWLDTTFRERTWWASTGGHLGNLSDPAFHKLLRQAVDRSGLLEH